MTAAHNDTHTHVSSSHIHVPVRVQVSFVVFSVQPRLVRRSFYVFSGVSLYFFVLLGFAVLRLVLQY